MHIIYLHTYLCMYGLLRALWSPKVPKEPTHLRSRPRRRARRRTPGLSGGSQASTGESNDSPIVSIPGYIYICIYVYVYLPIYLTINQSMYLSNQVIPYHTISDRFMSYPVTSSYHIRYVYVSYACRCTYAFVSEPPAPTQRSYAPREARQRRARLPPKGPRTIRACQGLLWPSWEPT